MKKFLSILLLISVLLSSLALSACNSDTPEDTAENTMENTEQENNEDEVELNIIDDNYRNWYEIFVYSFYDTDNDGIGDLNGVTAKLDYIQEMGFNGIWLMPIHPSPTYHKYDVTDYYAIRKFGQKFIGNCSISLPRKHRTGTSDSQRNSRGTGTCQ